MKDIFSDYLEINKLVKNILDSPDRGGNISIKTGSDIIIKPSGIDLKSDIVKITQVNEQKTYSIIGNEIRNIAYLKPSMELGFHKVLPSKYVLHYHPLYILRFLCGDAECLANIGDIVEYHHPGSCDLIDAISNTSKHIIFLKNHGVIIHSDTIEEIKQLYGVLREFNIFKDFMQNYTPDSCLIHSDEINLFNYVLKSFKCNELSDSDKIKLLSDENEIYRKSVK